MYIALALSLCLSLSFSHTPTCTCNRTWIPVDLNRWKHFKVAATDPLCTHAKRNEEEGDDENEREGDAYFDCYLQRWSGCSDVIGDMSTIGDATGADKHDSSVDKLKDGKKYPVHTPSSLFPPPSLSPLYCIYLICFR